MIVNPIKVNSIYQNNRNSHKSASFYPQFCAKGIYPGSFDPITNGHLDIIKRASKLFDELTVLIAINPEKKEFLPLSQRMKLIIKSVKDLTNVKVASYSGLTTDFAKLSNSDFMVRGIRDVNDFEYEKNLFEINKKNNSNIETIFIPTNPETAGISSSVVRNINKIGGNVSNFVPECVDRTLYLKKSFDDIVKNLGFDQEKSVEVFNKIIDTYDNPVRGYHDVKHIFSMLKNLDEFILNNPNSIQNLNEFKFAILMHDYVNGTPNEVNESIAVAEKFINQIAPNHNSNYIKRVILATDYSHNISKPSIDEMLIQDLDLSILGSNPVDYKEYANLIREQYSNLADDIFNNARKRILQNFLDKENIYNIDYFKTKYEVQARMNISKELETLK
ncbi:pantetheine-phosphate adenylyltransferase [bacterium]|nr:pantetheine-phosphate adenylyltransferase [bacterium]